MFHSNSWKKYYFIGFVFWAIYSMLSLFLTHLKLSKENCSYLPKNYHKVEMICPQQYKYCYIAKHFNSFDGHLVITWLCEMERHFKWTAVINLIACCLLIVDCWLLTISPLNPHCFIDGASVQLILVHSSIDWHFIIYWILLFNRFHVDSFHNIILILIFRSTILHLVYTNQINYYLELIALILSIKMETIGQISTGYSIHLKLTIIDHFKWNCNHDR